MIQKNHFARRDIFSAAASKYIFTFYPTVGYENFRLRFATICTSRNKMLSKKAVVNRFRISRSAQGKTLFCWRTARTEFMQSLALNDGEGKSLYIKKQKTQFGYVWPEVRIQPIQRRNGWCFL